MSGPLNASADSKLRQNGPPSNSPLFLPAVSLVSGVAAGRFFSFFPFTTATVSAVCLASVFFYGTLPFRRKAAALSFYMLGMLVFFLYGPGAPSAASVLVDKGRVAFTGEVVRPPQENEGYTVLMLEPRPPGEEGTPLPGRKGLVRLTVKGNGLGVTYGDVLSGELRLDTPRGFKNPGTFEWGGYAVLNGVDAVAYTDPSGLVRLGNRAGPFLKRLYSLRSELIARSEVSLPKPSSALFRAMVLGDQGGLTDDMRDEFSASGVTHILSVSGSHVALLAGLVFFLTRWAFFLIPNPWALRLSLRLDSRKLAAAVAIPAALFYCMLAGSETATVRSAIMVVVFLAAVLFDRDADLLNTLSAAAITTLLYDPSSVFDISFQLSYAAVFFMALAVRFMPTPPQGEGPGPAGRLRIRASVVLMTSVAAIAGTAPLAARQFNSFSYTALPANLLVLPVAGFAVVPLGLVSCLLYTVSPGEGLPLADINVFLLDAFRSAVRFFASAPNADLHPPAPGAALTVMFYAALTAGLLWRAGWKRKGVAALAMTAAFSSAFFLPQAGGKTLRVAFLDVGQGDSALVVFPGGRTMLIDGGGSPRGIDPGRAAVAPYLWNHGVRRVDYIVLTHPHPDHMHGLLYVLENFDIGQVWESGPGPDDEAYGRFKDAMAIKRIPCYRLAGNGELDIGGAAVQVLRTESDRPNDPDREDFVRENNRSLVLRVKYGGVSFLFAGDIEREAEESLLEAIPHLPLKSTVLKVPHHGSAGSCSEAFFSAVSPETAVISVGRHNRFRHPSPKTLAAIEETGAKVLRTDRDGAVTFATDGKRLEVLTYEGLSLQKARTVGEELANYGRLLR